MKGYAEHCQGSAARPIRVKGAGVATKVPQETGSESETQVRISETLDAMKDLLLYKNKLYGDSALRPRKGWYKGDAQNSILVRLMDKQARIDNNPAPLPRVNDVCDIIGYCTLLLISMDVTPDDIAKFKD